MGASFVGRPVDARCRAFSHGEPFLTQWTCFDFAITATFLPDCSISFLAQQGVHPPHDLERIRHVEHVGFPPRPPAIGIQIDHPALVDESPPDGVRLFPVIMPVMRCSLCRLAREGVAAHYLSGWVGPEPSFVTRLVGTGGLGVTPAGALRGVSRGRAGAMGFDPRDRFG